MDCKSARSLFEFARPQSGEMDSTELTAFEQHLASCPECDALSRGERGLDRAFAKAMQAVEVPAGLRTRLMDRLERERGDVHLRWFGHVGRATAAAAAIVLVVWGAYAWHQSHLPTVDMESAWEETHNHMVAPPGGDVLAEHFRRLGYDGAFPRDLNYSLLAYYGMGEFQGRQVPQLIFLNQGARAEVRILSAKQFNLTNPPTNFQSPDGYQEKIELWYDPAGCAEVVTYPGRSADWVR
jgi:hypothetical protein